MLTKSSKRYQDVMAIKLGEEYLNYKQLHEMSSTLSQHFQKGERVAILGQRNIDVYLGIYATVLAGATYVPINTKFPLQKKLDIIKAAKIQKLFGSLDDIKTEAPFIQKANLKQIITRDDKPHPSAIINSATDINDINDIAYIMFTSGSTGPPKGVLVTHGNVLSLFDNLDKFYPDLSPGYRCSQTFDLSFDPSICDMFYTWKNGGTLCILEEKELICASEYIKRESIHFWHSVPLLAEFMGKLGKLRPNEFPSLKYSIFTGEPVKKKVADDWKISAPNSAIENRYGPTETTVDVLRFNYQEKDRSKTFNSGVLPIGSTYHSLKFKIIHSDMSETSSGETGELLITGPQVTSGYLNDQEKTNQSFVYLDGDQSLKWYRTGDLAFINKDGDVECLGRIDKQIKLAGKRVEMGEIEYCLLKTGLIKDLIISPLKNKQNIVIALAGFTTDKIDNEIILNMRKKSQLFLDNSFFPKTITHLRNMPLLPSGKIDRNKLERLANE